MSSSPPRLSKPASPVLDMRLLNISPPRDLLPPPKAGAVSQAIRDARHLDFTTVKYDPFDAKDIALIGKQVHRSMILDPLAIVYVINLLTIVGSNIRGTSTSSIITNMHAVVGNDMDDCMIDEITKAAGEYTNSDDDDRNPKLVALTFNMVHTYIAKELLEVAGNNANDNRRNIIECWDIDMAVFTNPSLRGMFKHLVPPVCIVVGTTLPAPTKSKLLQVGATNMNVFTKAMIANDIQSYIPGVQVSPRAVDALYNAVLHIVRHFLQSDASHFATWLKTLPIEFVDTNLVLVCYRKLLGIIVAEICKVYSGMDLTYNVVVYAITNNTFYDLGVYLQK